jgi:hypothetical protein
MCASTRYPMKIKLHLDQAEYDPVARTAEALGCAPEELVFTALNLFMLRVGNFTRHCGPDCRLMFTNLDALRTEVQAAAQARKNTLPPWADSAGGPHVYESMPPEHSEKSSQSAF